MGGGRKTGSCQIAIEIGFYFQNDITASYTEKKQLAIQNSATNIKFPKRSLTALDMRS